MHADKWNRNNKIIEMKLAYIQYWLIRTYEVQCEHKIKWNEEIRADLSMGMIKQNFV